MNWICKHCGQSFPSRRKLQEHNKIEHNIGPRGKGQTAWNKGLTKENNEIMQQIAKHCSETLKGKPGHKHTEETKKKLSEIRKKQIAENDGIWWNSRSKCKRSYAEEWTKRLLENEFKRTDFVEEYHIGKWFLDFAWPAYKLYIEIDGEQHEWPERKKNDEEKDRFCLSEGWKGLRIKWKEICNDTQNAIKRIKDFLPD